MPKNYCSGPGMGRRDFIKSSSLMAGGLTLSPGLFSNLNADRQFNVNTALNVRTNIKMVLHGIVHEKAYEGSCRYGDLDNLSEEAERTSLMNWFEKEKEQIAGLSMPRGINFLEPTVMNSWVEGGNPDIMLSNDQVESLYEDDPNVDFYVTNHMFPGIKIAERYKKPVVILQKAGWAVDMPARLRYMGLEGYHVKDYDELKRLAVLMHARKAFANTKMLYVTNFPYRIPWGCISSAVTDMDKIKKHYGFDYKFVDYEEFFADMDKLVASPAISKKRKATAEQLLKNAGHSNMKLTDIEKSLDFYYAVMASMEKYDCNAFTIECHELCSSMNPAKRRFTPCLTHAMLKDSGVPSACEGDVNVLMAMMVEMYVSNKAIYMGNPFFNREDNTLRLKHSVCSLKMNGLESENTPYDIHSFATGMFGATLRHDFSKDAGKVCTVARFDPSGMKILVSRGEIITGDGMTGYGCDQDVTLKMKDCYEFWRASQNYGHHMALVFGDYTQEIRDLADMLKFEIELIA